MRWQDGDGEWKQIPEEPAALPVPENVSGLPWTGLDASPGEEQLRLAIESWKREEEDWKRREESLLAKVKDLQATLAKAIDECSRTKEQRDALAAEVKEWSSIAIDRQVAILGLEAELEQVEKAWAGRLADEDANLRRVTQERDHLAGREVSLSAEVEHLKLVLRTAEGNLAVVAECSQRKTEQRDALADALLECWRVETEGTARLEEMGVPTPPSPWLAVAEDALRKAGRLP